MFCLASFHYVLSCCFFLVLSYHFSSGLMSSLLIFSLSLSLLVSSDFFFCIFLFIPSCLISPHFVSSYLFSIDCSHLFPFSSRIKLFLDTSRTNTHHTAAGRERCCGSSWSRVFPVCESTSSLEEPFF